MNETVTLIVELLIVPFALVLWWLFRKQMFDIAVLQKTVAENFANHEKALADFKLQASEKYATRDDLADAVKAINRAVDAIFAKLERIEDKLDHKADK